MQHKSGLYFSLISSLALAIMGFLVSKATLNFQPAEVLFLRSILTILILGFVIRNEFSAFSKVAMKWFVLRAFCGGTAVLIYFYNLQALGPSLAISIASLSVVFSFLIGMIVNRERLTFMQFVGIVLCNFSLFFLTSKLRLIDSNQLLFGLFGALLTALSYQFMKRAAEANLSTNAVYFGYAIASLISSLFLINNEWKIPGIRALPLIVAIVLTSWLGQTFLNLAYMRLGNAKASALGRLVLIWAFVIELIFGVNEPTLQQLALYFITILGAFFITFDKRLLEPIVYFIGRKKN